MNDFREQVPELLKLGLIRISTSPWSSPAFMVRNHSEVKRGKARIVIDYSKLNVCTKKIAYSLPNKDNLFLNLRHCKYFSKFDCKSGFHQVKMDERSVELTAFGTPLGLYEWLVMPFGLTNAPAIFQSKMDQVLKNT